MVMRGGKSGSDDNRASASIRSRLLMFETKEGQKVVAACIEFGGWHHRDKTLMPIHLSALLTMLAIPAWSGRWTVLLRRPKRAYLTGTDTSSNFLQPEKTYGPSARFCVTPAATGG
jgi:hypothetical protein